MTTEYDSRLWHPFADMGTVRHRELIIDRGEDVWVWDSEGNRYLDATASLWYANIGHGRARDRGRRRRPDAPAGGVLLPSATSPTPPALELAERLAELAPMDDARVFFGSGGGDGIDTAAKLARRYFAELGEPERDHVIVAHPRLPRHPRLRHGARRHRAPTAPASGRSSRTSPRSRTTRSTRCAAGFERVGAGAGRRRVRRAGDRRRRRLPAARRLHRGRRGAVPRARASCSSPTR